MYFLVIMALASPNLVLPEDGTSANLDLRGQGTSPSWGLSGYLSQRFEPCRRPDCWLFLEQHIFSSFLAVCLPFFLFSGQLPAWAADKFKISCFLYAFCLAFKLVSGLPGIQIQEFPPFVCFWLCSQAQVGEMGVKQVVKIGKGTSEHRKIKKTKLAG